MSYAVSLPTKATRVRHQRARGELDSARYYEGFHAPLGLGTDPWFREPTCDDFWPELTCKKQESATAQKGVYSAGERGACAAEGGTINAEGYCVHAPAPPNEPSAGGGGSDDASWWEDDPGSAGGGSRRTSGGDGSASLAGMSTTGWFVVAAGVMAVGLFAYDAMTGAGTR